METTDDGRYVLRYERRLRHPIEKVWDALTDPDAAWRSGGRGRRCSSSPRAAARGIEWLNGDAVAEGRITRLEPPTTIEFDTDIHGRLLWELQPDDDGTHLTLTVTNALPDEYRTSVHGRLARAPRLPRGRARRQARSTGRTGREDRWAELNEHYEASMRPIS